MSGAAVGPSPGAVLEDVLRRVQKAAPGAEAIARFHHVRAGNTRFARNRITSTGDHEDTTVSLTLALGKRHASVDTNQLAPASLDELVARAVAIARLCPEDPEWMPPLGPRTYATVEAASDAATSELPATKRVEAVTAAIGVSREAAVTGAGFFEHQSGRHALASTSGLRAERRSSSASFTMTARTDDGTGSGWAGAESARAGDLAPRALMRVAADKATRSQKPVALEPGRYTVVLEPAAVADLLAFLVGSLDARRADEGRSFFARKGGGTRLGEKLFGEATLRSDPLDPATPGASFDDEGLPLSRVTWIDKGVLAALAYSRFWGAKKGQAPTGHHRATHLMGGAAESSADLLAGVKKGLLVTRFWYTRWVDQASLLVTGLTRDGVFLVEDGKVVRAVSNFRFNESPAVMLRNADASTRETFRVPFGADTVMRVPFLRTHEFNMASVSAAV